jgi:cellulose synthase/poly-beta-1,6-N-acetylglucosamine synthase-like glycosyltransferase
LKVIGLGNKIYYLENALVFDEKVDSPHAFKQQRNRWVLGQFIYLKQFFIPAIKYLFKGNPSYFNIAVLNNLVLPRAFLFLLLPLLVLASYFISMFWMIAAIGVLAIFMLAMIISLPAGLINKDLFQAILRIPRAIGLMAGSLFRGKKANKTFIHTVHTKTEVTNTYLMKKSVKDKL